MAQVTDYGTLKAWLSTTGHRGDLSAEIPGFIQSAESMIAEKVRAIELITSASIDATDRIDNVSYNLPTNFLGARALTGTRSSQGYPLTQISIDELYRYGFSGQPIVYSIYGRTVEFRAAPETDTIFTLIYFARPAAFVQDADTNTLLTAHPDLYQHAALHWFHIHTQDVELAAAHESTFLDAVDSINGLADEVRGAATVANQYSYSYGGTM